MLLQEIYRALIKSMSSSVKKMGGKKAKYLPHDCCDADINHDLIELTGFYFIASLPPVDHTFCNETKHFLTLFAGFATGKNTCIHSHTQIQSGKHSRAFNYTSPPRKLNTLLVF